MGSPQQLSRSPTAPSAAHQHPKGGIWIEKIEVEPWDTGRGEDESLVEGGELPTCPDPTAGTGLKPTILASALSTVDRIPAELLSLYQVGEADADGAQGLRVVRVHDVTQESHPEILDKGKS